MSKHRALESFRVFPYIAWGLIIGFSVFVFSLVQELRIVQAEKATASSRLEELANTNPLDISDYSR
jgi:hypothetical protein